jgi:hypothetical protein
VGADATFRLDAREETGGRLREDVRKGIEGRLSDSAVRERVDRVRRRLDDELPPEEEECLSGAIGIGQISSVTTGLIFSNTAGPKERE